MLDPGGWSVANIPDDVAPRLVVLVDTEEEFDWNAIWSRDSTNVSAITAQLRAHRIFEKFGIKPLYAVDYPVASQAEGYLPLRELLDDGRCEIGAHLHPWVNPPFDEEISRYNSYPGNLSPGLEHAKLERLTATIEDNFGISPRVYKAGRYGVGPRTPNIIDALGYQIDASVVPGRNLSGEEGPDFSPCGARPYWFGPEGRLLELPMSVAFTGRLAAHGRAIHPAIASDRARHLRLTGVFARLRLLDRVTLTPEGITSNELRRLTNSMLSRGHRIFSFTYHSPSMAPGNTPYVRSDAELQMFLDKFERYFEFFFGEIGGQAATPDDVRTLLLAKSPSAMIDSRADASTV